MSTKIPAYRQVQIEIKKYIKENNLKFGDGLPPEALLAKNLGVSRPSLREAVKSLESLGIVESRHGEGIFVKEFTFDSIVENLPYSMNAGDENVKKLLHVRKYLELGAIPSVVEHITEESIQRLRVLAERMLNKALDKQTFSEEDREFHVEMYSCLKNDFLLSLIELFWNVFNEMNQSSESVDHWALEETAKDHLRVVNMLEKKDVFGVLSAHREHFQAIVDTYPEE
ncbi:FadR/GntR family transcriptional regulator [Glaciimonas soli]|uniref:FadR/GntR family transcriptional regulator n=1 Tax=Glaciimonas soli TaxID=2590999 RepID=UPI001884D08B|nr:FadR/GntR family transcriptional regulator [Glaciimonas soli]